MLKIAPTIPTNVAINGIRTDTKCIGSSPAGGRPRPIGAAVGRAFGKSRPAKH